MTEASEERRRWPRHKYKTRIWLDLGAGLEPVPTTSVNISARGLLIESEKMLALDSNVRISIELPFFSDPIKALGRVVRIATGGVGERKRFGIDLVAVEGVTEEQLHSFLDSLLG